MRAVIGAFGPPFHVVFVQLRFDSYSPVGVLFADGLHVCDPSFMRFFHLLCLGVAELEHVFVVLGVPAAPEPF